MTWWVISCVLLVGLGVLLEHLYKTDSQSSTYDKLEASINDLERRINDKV